MKPDFFVARATSKTFKIFCLCSEKHLTFREDRVIQIAAKFQSKIPLIRTVAVRDTISWSGGFPQRKSFTFLQRSWRRKAAVDVNTSLRPHFRNNNKNFYFPWFSFFTEVHGPAGSLFYSWLVICRVFCYVQEQGKWQGAVVNVESRL